jgi:hypothetical protein
VPRFSSEALLNAGIPWPTVQAVAGKGFCPELPAFNSIVDQEDPQPLTAVTQRLRRPLGGGEDLDRRHAYASSGISLAYLQSAAIVVGATDRNSIGDQHLYYLTTLTDGSPSTRFYFIHVQAGAKIEADGQLWSRSKIARLAAPLDQRITKMVADSLHAASIRAVEIAHLPAPAKRQAPSSAQLRCPPRRGRPRSTRARRGRSETSSSPPATRRSPSGATCARARRPT